MTYSNRFIAPLLIALFFLSGCSSEPKVVESDSGKLIKIRAGETFLVELSGNPATGYMWEVSEADASILRQTNETIFKADRNSIGSPGKFNLRFKAIAPGKTTLALAYRRPWEKNVPPLNTYKMDVEVR